MLCEEILNEDIRKETYKVCHSDIWSTLSKQISTIKVFEKLFKIRNLKIEKKKLSHRDPGVTSDESSSYAAQYMTLD